MTIHADLQIVERSSFELINLLQARFHQRRVRFDDKNRRLLLITIFKKNSANDQKKRT